MNTTDIIPDRAEGWLLVEDRTVVTGFQLSKMPPDQRRRYQLEIDSGERVRTNSDAYMLRDEWEARNERMTAQASAMRPPEDAGPAPILVNGKPTGEYIEYIGPSHSETKCVNNHGG